MGYLALERLKKYKMRWIYLVATVIVMMIISIYQYSWSIFAKGIQSEFKWELPAIQVAFTIFAYAATFIQPFSGYFADRFGPRLIAIIGAILTSIGFLATSTITSLPQLYLYYGLGSLGVGMMYGLSAALAIKWFPDRRGLATGITTFGFGAGTSLFNPVFINWINSLGVRATFLYTGIIMIVILFPLSFIYIYPEFLPQLRSSSTGGSSGSSEKKVEEKKETKPTVDTTNFKWYEMLRTYQWWLIYLSFTMIAAIALLFGANLSFIAKERKIPTELYAIASAAFPLTNGFSRILGGYISDYIGRQNTATLFYALSGVLMIALAFNTDPVLFTILVPLVMLFAGAVFAFNPAFIGDFYGPRYSTTNYGITYTAKAWGGLVSGYITAWLVATLGSYSYSMIGLGVGALIAAFLVNPFILKKPVKKI